MSTRTLMLASVLLGLAGSTIAGLKPARSECIIGYKMDFSGLKAHHADITNAMTDYFGRPGWEEVFPGFAISGVHGDRLYLQYDHDCDKKVELAAKLIEMWRTEGLALPKFERLKEPIIPSPWTIDLQGSPWRDGGYGPGDVHPEDIQHPPNREIDI
jgi:hypothetical protein